MNQETINDELKARKPKNFIYEWSITDNSAETGPFSEWRADIKINVTGINEIIRTPITGLASLCVYIPTETNIMTVQYACKDLNRLYDVMSPNSSTQTGSELSSFLGVDDIMHLFGMNVQIQILIKNLIDSSKIELTGIRRFKLT